MPLLRLGKPEQYVAFLAGPALGQLPITCALSALVGEVLPPAADLGGRTGSRGGHLHIMATAGSTIRGEMLVKKPC